MANLDQIILVTGGIGFIGSHFVELLLAENKDTQIRILDKLTYAANIKFLEEIRQNSRVEFIKGDICNLDDITNAMVGCRQVVHFAAESHVPNSFKNPELFFNTNVLGTRNVVSVALNQKVARLVHISTDEIYGATFSPVPETHMAEPTTPYATSKYEAEREIESARNKGLDALIIRPTNALGPRQHREKLVPRFVELSLSGQAYTIEGEGKQSRTFLPVTDLVNGVFTALTKGGAQETYNIAGRECISVIEMARIISQITQVPARFKYCADRVVNDASYQVSDEKLRALGYVQASNIKHQINNILLHDFSDSHKFSDCIVQMVSAKNNFEHSPTVLQFPSTPEKLPQQDQSIAFHLPHKARDEKKNLLEAIDGQSRFGGQFSKRAAQLLETRFEGSKVFLTNSCTSAMEIAAIASNIGPGDEVIVPTFTFAATATAFARCGAKIVLCGVDPSTMMIDCADAYEKITSRTKAIVPVHYGGAVADLVAFTRHCHKLGIMVIEDAAQAIGAKIGDQAAGTIGDFGAFSFHETKIAHCGHGGALLVNTDDADILNRVDIALNRGTNFSSFVQGQTSHYEWVGLGSSFQPTELQAAQLTAQLDELDNIIVHRKALFEHYLKHLGHMMMVHNYGVVGNGHAVICIMKTSQEAQEMIADAQTCGIHLSSHYKPLHLSKAGQDLGYSASDMHAASDLWDRVVRLPIYTQMTISDVNCVIDFVKNHQSRIVA